MLEYRRAWRAKALQENTLAEKTMLWIERTIKAFAEVDLVARAQFIRRPQRSAQITLLVAQNGHLSGTTVNDEAELQAIDLVSTSLPEAPGPQYFVCTNAKRDLCCAKFGRPTFAALHRALPERAWQTTHVGGHRYAPNVLTLPDANMYGRVTADKVAHFLQSTERNLVAAEYLRGNSGHSKSVQLALHALLQQNSDIEPTAYKLLRETEESVTFATPDGVKEVAVTEGTIDFQILPSCDKPEESIRPSIARVLDMT